MDVVISDIPLIRKEIFMYQQICNNDGYLRISNADTELVI